MVLADPRAQDNQLSSGLEVQLNENDPLLEDHKRYARQATTKKATTTTKKAATTTKKAATTTKKATTTTKKAATTKKANLVAVSHQNRVPNTES